MRVADLLFDLDGTLVDSAPVILESFRRAITATGAPLVTPLDRSVIGAPLGPTLRRLTGLEDETRLAALAAAFRATYDDEGVRTTPGYPGLADVLRTLAAKGRRLYVVTNKRALPTRAILDQLGVSGRCTGVYALDGVVPPAADKRALVGLVLERHGIVAAECALVGDTVEDAAAARAHHLAFIAATYGYGSPLADPRYPAAGVLERLADLPALLERLP
ncbi:MAG TPA: HAD family hydrolase [Gemmatimonadaceae bacterium]|nr:HAD family hydrolase [Gemmatimonadaceae bacterium]